MLQKLQGAWKRIFLLMDAHKKGKNLLIHANLGEKHGHGFHIFCRLKMPIKSLNIFVIQLTIFVLAIGF